MDIARFETEHFFGAYEFTVPHVLSCSDCESTSVAELLRMGGSSAEEFGALELHYTEPRGHPELRRAIADGYKGVTADDVMVLGTPVEGIYLLMRALLEPGDEVIVLSPCYDALHHVAAHVGAAVRRWELVPTADGWELDHQALDEMLGSRTKLVVLNLPHNPTGYLGTAEELRAVMAKLAARGVRLFCDEMYRGLEFGSAPQLPSAVESSDSAVVLSGLSKAHGLPGLRTGWLVTRDGGLLDSLENWKFYTSICPPAPSEFLARVALRAAPALLDRNCAIVRENVATADRFFASKVGAMFTWRRPTAGSVGLVEVGVASATRWCHELAADPGVLLLPGDGLGAADRFVRFGFGRRDFEKSLEVLRVHLGTGGSSP